MKKELIKACLLGTQRYMPELTDMPGQLADVIGINNGDNEASLLTAAAFYSLMQSAGTPEIKLLSVEYELVTENLPHVNKQIESFLLAALKQKEDIVLQYLCYKMGVAKQIIPAIWVPTVFSLVKNERKRFQYLLSFCGSTGKWLQKQNPEYNFEINNIDTIEEDLEIVTFERRMVLLEEKRKKAPGEANELISRFMQNEPADKRALMTTLLGINYSQQDTVLVTSLLNDKSKKVREAAYAILRQFPGNPVFDTFMQHLSAIAEVVEERHLLISKKQVLKMKSGVKPGKILIEAGLVEICSEKNINDEWYHLAQILSFVPFKRIAEALKVNELNLFNLLSDQSYFNFLAPYLAISAEKFEDVPLVRLLLKKQIIFGLIALLPKQEADQFYLNALSAALQNKETNFNLTQLLRSNYTETFQPLDEQLCKKVLAFLKMHPYGISAQEYKLLGFYFPASLEYELDNLTNLNSDEYALIYLKNQLLELKRYLEIKKSINISI